MKNKLFTGVATALATPFIDEKINFKVFEEFIELQINSGINALVVCGTTGEASTMSQNEKIDLIKCAISVTNKRVPIIVGTGSNNTLSAIEMSKIAEKLGADGLLVVTPYYNKTTQNGLIEHYKSISNSVSIPIILYNVPSRTGMNISPETCLELSKIENIVGIKEASGNISQITKIASLCGDNLPIYSGNDDQVMPILSLGGKGVISVLANVAPKETHDMVQKYLDGDVVGAREIQIKAIPLCEALFCEVNPIPVKKAVELMGLCEGNLRMPLTELEPEHTEQLKKAMTGFGVKIQ